MARYTGGYLKLWRSVLESDIGENGHCLAIWTWLLLAASWKEFSFSQDGTTKTYPAGSVVYGQRELATQLGFPLTTVNRWIKFLVRTERIRNETGTRGSIATICNWNEYQSPEEVAEHKRNTSGTRPELYEEDKKEEVFNTPILKTGNTEEKTKTKKKRTPAHRLVYSSEFEFVWKTYGRRGDKAEAFSVFQDLDSSEQELVLKAVKVYVAKNPELQFRKHLQRFLLSDWRAHLENSATQQFQFTDSTQEAS